MPRTPPLDEMQLSVLTELGLPLTTSTQSGALGVVTEHLRVARTNSRLQAVFFASKENRQQPAELQGKESSIKFVHLETVSKATMYALASPLRELGNTVVPYAKGYLVTLNRDDD
ncbi:MAG: hypothetical protein JWM89_1822 [Acidimicrobiales bacterium]|nr:hypothetical protein [Acidimicrobiales bacterium]